MKRYSAAEKAKMIEMYAKHFSYTFISKYFGCSISTVFYVTHHEAYEKHKEYIRNCY